MEKKKQKFERPTLEIDSLHLPERVRTACAQNKIWTIPDLKEAYENSSLASLRGIGPSALQMIKIKLENPDAELPKKNQMSKTYLPQISKLLSRAEKEGDTESFLALRWALNVLYAKAKD